MSAASNSTKKTIYVDVDEEITGIIDKVRSTNESLIALVLPKRATVLQSIINMKLLKRSADQTDKKVVLITSESTLMPLAGAAGLHVAANLQSRPYLPALPGVAPAAIAATEPIDPETPIGDLAAAKDADSVKPIEIDNRPKVVPLEPKAAASPKSPKKDKTKKVPNFQKFRTLLFVGAAVIVLLIIGLYWALAIAPKATITLRTQSSEAATSAKFSADTDATEINLESDVVPALSKETKKTETEKVAATGQKDIGTKASGSVTLRNCTDDKVTIPAGTGISNGSLTFITQSTVNLKEGEFSSKSSGSQCRATGDHTATISVVAQNNGDQFNLSPRSYTVSGASGVVAQGEQMSGGTTKNVKVVSSQDVESAKKKISDKQNAVVEQLKNELKTSGYIGLVDTFSNGTPSYTATPAVGAESPDVTVAGDVVYSMLGIKEADLKKIVEDQSKDTIDKSKQTILSYGFDDATFEVGAKKGSTTDITLKTTLQAGPEIDQNALKTELAGQKRGDVVTNLKSRPGITDAQIKFKPFWVSKVPSKPAKVTLIIQQADGKPVTP